MPTKVKVINTTGFHPENVSAPPYDMTALAESHPELKALIIPNRIEGLTVDFQNPDAVYHLNKAMLIKYFGIKNWDIAKDSLVPGVPIRSEYLYRMRDFLNSKKIEGPIKVVDIGTGGNLIYPIIGVGAFNWKFVASDIDQKSLDNAHAIVHSNKILDKKIELRMQNNPAKVFENIILKDEIFHLSICNPPFHANQKESLTQRTRKQKNLAYKNTKLNFQGRPNELWTAGGEFSFVERMIRESYYFKSQINYFSTLISKNENLAPLIKILTDIKVTTVDIIEMEQGNKKSRILIWNWN
ncbi:MAG: 23S rRNA (adenine(1618)-N(6))-methyltransferase RlmF [Saprospiraceae bacterium]|nr:23S rRNA (adenine(1618)-N(6))-methyltransferase RlmF [Saprospiraceae bacterium]